MKTVRFGVIGVGGMGTAHAKGIVEAKDASFNLAAVADIDAARARKVGRELGVKWFADGPALIESGLVDAVLVATPHYFHPPLAIRAARAGLHVLTEKPMAVSVGPAREMVRQCARRKLALGVMFQQRNRANMRTMKQMLDAGEVGEVFRVQMICSTWYRTQAYYDGGSWRGTWNGEGGGILLNQAPHSLDLFQWIGGMPRRVLARVGTRHHRIEVENTANAILEYEGGKTGYIYATTAEAPGMEQLLVAGDKGTLVADGQGGLRFGKLALSLKKHLATSKEAFVSPPCQWRDVPLPQTSATHIDITRAFVDHVLRGGALVASGKEGINELELSNAIYISGYRNKPVTLPVDAAEMERLLSELARRHDTGKSENFRRQSARELKQLLGKFPA